VFEPGGRAERFRTGVAFLFEGIVSGDPPVETAKEFTTYATTCQSMARTAKDPESKAAWLRLAERWRLCAKLADEQERYARTRDPKRRPRSPALAGLERRIAALSQR
jgi:hypothetical protein